MFVEEQIARTEMGGVEAFLEGDEVTGASFNGGGTGRNVVYAWTRRGFWMFGCKQWFLYKRPQSCVAFWVCMSLPGLNERQGVGLGWARATRPIACVGYEDLLMDQAISSP